ncbi:MAG: SpoIIE family protein phosphatase [Gemmatimonadota bacterium]|nr:SpoIIE family protein phosphatase [Gemmatimonadota bacterium]
MSDDGPRRILILSSRPDIVADVARAAARLDPPVSVVAPRGLRPRATGTDLVLADIAEPRATAQTLRARFGPDATLVALIEGAWASRLGDALSGEWDDYLFYPVNLDELGLLWRRHRAPSDVPELSLDVDEEGRVRAVIPSDVRYQRPAVARVVEACRHLGHLDAETAFRLRVSLGEAVANAILYGSGERRGAVVRIEAIFAPDGLRVRVEDEGPGFDPSSVPDPTVGPGLQRSRGRGLFLLRQMADEVRFNDVGNEVTLIFRGALDPLSRIQPWLGEFSELTGLRFRLERHHRGETERLHDAWSEAGESPPERGELESLPLGPAGVLELLYLPPDRERTRRALDLLAGWLEALAEGDESRERLLERRMRRARVLAELEVARDLQLRLLPSPERFADLARVAARCEPALSLGGDFYFLSRLPRGRLGVMLGDVSSHGPSAALIMALTLSAAAVVTAGESSPAWALDRLRAQLMAALASTEMYMTLFYGIMDPEGTLTYANAGHPYAYRIDGPAMERLPALDPPLGMSTLESHERVVPWSAADVLLAFTDGLAEAGDPIEPDASRIRGLPVDEAVEPRRLVEALFAATEDDLRLDDRTAVAARW